ncbi:MAG: UMP kinase [Planctomycetota bacterium]
MAAKYRRILLKISGESLCSAGASGLEGGELELICQQIRDVARSGVQVAVVMGGGNFLRGATFAQQGFGRSQADYMGMMATLINGLALQDKLEQLGCDTRLASAIPVSPVAENFIRRRVIRHMEKGRVVLLAAGTGNPGFTTDTAAAIRAFAVEADVLFKATTVDGIYDKDPKKHKDAVKYERLGYMDVISRQLKVMDMAAFSVCMEHKMPIYIFNYRDRGNLMRAVNGENVGTYVGDDA